MDLQIFKNPEFGTVRTVSLNDGPWFIGKDVAEILGYSNTRKALLDHVDEEDKTDGVTIRDSIGREQEPADQLQRHGEAAWHRAKEIRHTAAGEEIHLPGPERKAHALPGQEQRAL